jgi:transcriptional regulator with XRE-family HTH domain
MGNTFGQRFRTARLERNLTQYGASELIFGTRERQAEISRWEADKQKPGIEALALVAERFNISADELIGVSRTLEAIA